MITKSTITIIFMGLYLLSFTSVAKNIGNYGQVFPVLEMDIRQVILSRLKAMERTGELARHQHDIEHKISEHIVRPTPLMITPTSKPETFHIDPTILVAHDIWTPDGMLVARSGMRINPFQHIKFSKTLFFFNADDARQVAWAKSHYQDFEHVKFILTGGDIREASAIFGRLYFDVEGRITEQLHIKHVPSVVSQDGLLWQVREIGVNDA